MRKGSGANGVPAWVKMDLRMLKRVSVSLVEMQRGNQRRFAENEIILARLEEQTTSLKDQTASLKRLSDIHSKSILKLLRKI